jgi:hypothetical protein
MATVKQRFTDKAIRTFVTEAESWKLLREEEASCLDFEELLSLGHSAFEAIGHWDAIWHQKVNDLIIPYDADDEQHIFLLYQLWLAPSVLLLEEITRLEKSGYKVTGADTFRLHCDEVRDMMVPDQDFFGAELVEHQDEALAAHRRGETTEFTEMGD